MRITHSATSTIETNLWTLLFVRLLPVRALTALAAVSSELAPPTYLERRTHCTAVEAGAR